MDNPAMSSPQSTTVALKARRRMDFWTFKALVQEHPDLDLGVGLQSSRFRKVTNDTGTKERQAMCRPTVAGLYHKEHGEQ